MYLSRLIGRGFGTLEHFDLTFPAATGVYVIEGENGVGKTQLMEVLDFVLFNRTSRGVGGQDVLNELDENAVEVYGHAEFSVDGKLFAWVHRTVQRGKDGFVLEGVFGDVQLAGHTSTEKQEHLQAQLGLPSWRNWFTSFHATPYYAYLSLGEAEQNDTFDAFSGATRFQEAAKLAEKTATALDLDVSECAGKYNTLASVRAALAGQFLVNARQRASMTGRNEELVAQLRAEVDALASKDAAWQQHVEQLREVGAGYQQRLKIINQHLTDAEDKLGPDKGWQVEELRRRHAECARAASAEFDKLEKVRSGLCALCGKPDVAPEVVARLESSYAGLYAEHQSVGSALHAATQAGENWRAEQARLEPLRQMKVMIETTIAQNGDQIRAAEIEHGKVGALHRQRSADLAAALNAVAPLPDPTLLVNLRDTALNFKHAAEALKPLQKKAEIARYWAKTGFTRAGVRQFLRDRVLPQVNELLHRNASILSQGARSVQLVSEEIRGRNGVSERVVARIINASGSKNVAKNSAGERQTYDLAVFGAFNAVARQRSGFLPNCLLLDEVFSHISQARLADVGLFLRTLAETTQIFIAAHQPALTGEFENRIVVTKENARSRVTASWMKPTAAVA